MDTPQVTLELDELIKSAQKQPGVADLIFVYGQYVSPPNQRVNGVLSKNRRLVVTNLYKQYFRTCSIC